MTLSGKLIHTNQHNITSTYCSMITNNNFLFNMTLISPQINLKKPFVRKYWVILRTFLNQF